MKTRGHPPRPETQDQQRAWDLLTSVENHPQVQVWLRQAESSAPRRFGKARAAAAAVILAIGASVGAWLLQASGSHYQTRIGEQRDVILPDGSKVTLNTDTALTVRYSDEQRYVVLERGEALFAVEHDATRPFDVAAGDTRTRALGTEFNVYMHRAKVTVSVLEGAVRVAAATVAGDAHDAAPTALTPVAALAKGQALEFRAEDRRVSQEKADLKRIDAWRTRRLEFSDTPLSEAVDELNRYSTTRITLGAADLGSIRVSGIFRIGDQDGFLFSLREALRIESHRSQHEIVLLRAPSGPASEARASNPP